MADTPPTEDQQATGRIFVISLHILRKEFRPVFLSPRARDVIGYETIPDHRRADMD